MDYKLIADTVRVALMEKAQRELGQDPGEQLPLFLELNEHVKAIVPAVQEIYDRMGTVGRIWKANGVDKMLAAIEPTAVPLDQGKITAIEWQTYQLLFYGFMQWAVAPTHLPTDPEGVNTGPSPLEVISQRSKG